MKFNAAETLLAVHLTERGIAFEREYRFDAGCCGHPKRKHRPYPMDRRLTYCTACPPRSLPFEVHDYDAGRQWRADFYLPDYELAVEIEGGRWVNGRHNRATGFARDIEKYNALTKAGIGLLRFTPEQVEDGSAIAFILEVIGG